MEIWKDITWYEWKYQVSSHGNVKSMNYSRTWKEKTMSLFSWGRMKYVKAILFKDWRHKNVSVHRLVWQAFMWLDITDRKILVCHKDDDPSNNHVDNLFLWTFKDNTEDMISKWRQKWKDKTVFHIERKKRIVAVDQFSLDNIFIRSWNSIMDVETELWFDHSSISKCCKWARKQASWFIWKLSNPDNL